MYKYSFQEKHKPFRCLIAPKYQSKVSMPEKPAFQPVPKVPLPPDPNSREGREKALAQWRKGKAV